MNWSGPSQPLRASSVLAWFHDWPQRSDLAVRDDKGGQLSYKQLHSMACSIAAGLQQRGAGPGKRVGLTFERSVESYATFLGILFSGASFVPLDPAQPANLRESIAQDAGLQLRLPASLETGQQEAYCPPPLGPEDEVYLMYTSGSTGQPKGVPVLQASLLNLMQSMVERLCLNRSDRVLSLSSWSFDISLLELLLPAYCGAQLILGPADATGNPLQLVRAVRAAQCTFLQATPSTWRLLYETCPEITLPQTVASGGEALSEPLAAFLYAGSRSAWNLYGPTETCIWSMAWAIQPGPVYLGEPLGNTDLYLVGEDGHPVADGQPGELHIGGLGVAPGYWERPDLTADRFREGPGGRIYRTGDLVAHTPEGFRFLGRLDNQVKIGGLRLELEGIESHLRTHPKVRAAVVCSNRESEQPSPVDFYQADEKLDSSDLRRFLSSRLPSGAIPTGFYRIEQIPLNSRGKVDRAALLQVHLDNEQPSEPRLIWKQVLGSETSGEEDFFESGATSLQVLELCRQLELNLGREVTVAVVYQERTLSRILARLKQPPRTHEGGLVRLREGSGPRFILCHTFTGGLPQSLAESLPQEWDLWGLLPVAVASPDLAAQARLQLQVIQEFGTGRLRLVGYSFGALLAYEVACQARLSGAAVDFVCLIDPPPLWRRRLPRLPHAWQARLLSLAPRGRWFYQLAFWMLRFGLLETLPLEWARELLWTFPGYSTLSPYAQNLAGWNYLCETTYCPGLHEGRASLICTPKTRSNRILWQSVVGQLQTRVVDGDHYALLNQPLVSLTAQIVAECWESTL